MWFRNLIVYTLPGTLPLSAEELGPLLAPQAFIPGGRLEALRVGWAPPQPDDPALVCSVGGQLLLSLRQEKKLLPARVITQTVAERARLIEAEEGFKPGRKRLRELKDQVRDELLPRAFSLSSDTRVWIDPAARRLAVEAVSAARADEVVGLLLKAVEGLVIRPLRTEASPAGEMTAGLAEGEAPAGFTIDQDAELRARDSKASVRFANQTLDHEDILRHTRAGKQCARLALTWSARVAFVLTDRMEIRRIRPQDVIKETAAGHEGDAAERFASDMSLMTGELSRLLDALIAALGGAQAAV